MGAKLQGVLAAARGLGFLVTLTAAGCAGALPRPAPAVTLAQPGSLPSAPPVVSAPKTAPLADSLGPEVLLPAAQSVDPEVARVGDVVLRQSDAYARLLSANPKLALSAVDLLVFDVLVAKHAQQHGVTVEKPRVEALAAAEEAQLRAKVAAELDGVAFADYVWRLFGMRESDWRVALRLRTAQRLYQGYVLRYLALREDRVQVRFLVHDDRSVAEEVCQKVRVGADFATLARQLSEDPTRRDGGLLPAFGRGFAHPAARIAFDLQPGEVCDPFQAAWGGKQRWFVVYCLQQQAGREVAFAQVRDEIDQGLAARPVTPLETTAYTMRWRREEGGAAAEGKQ